MKTIDKIGGLLVKPDETVTALLHGAGNFAESVAIVLFFSTTLWVSIALHINRIASAALTIVPLEASILASRLATPAIIGGIVFIGLTHDLVNFLAGGVVVHFVASVLDGAGDMGQVIVLNGYTWVALVFLLAGSIAVAFSFIAGLLVLLALLPLTWIWHIYLLARGVSESHGITMGRAFIAAISWDLLKILVLAVLAKVV